MNKYLLIRYKNLSATYHKLVQRLESNISKGVFSKFSANKRRVLLHRVGRLQIKLLRLRQQLGMAATTGALVVSGLSIVTESQAQVRAVPNGDMLAVNTFKNNNQVNSTVAVDSDGDFVVVWQDNRNTTNSYDIYLQRYNAAGNPLGNEVLVNENFTNGPQINPSVDMDADGDFVVAWQGAGTGDNEGIFAQPFNATGSKTGNILQINGFTTNTQANPSIALDEDGDFVISWQSNSQDGSGDGIFVRRFTKSGIAQEGIEFLVNTTIAGNQTMPGLDMSASGDFIIAWESNDGSSNGIFARRYSATGLAQGAEFAVNTYTTNIQSNPAVANMSSGNFIITWTSTDQDGSGTGIYARRYASNIPGAEFQVNTFTTSNQSEPSTSKDEKGNFIIVWQGAGDGDAEGVFARRYSNMAVAQEPKEFLVTNTSTSNKQSKASIAMDAGGGFVITWNTYTSNEDIFAQRYTLPGREEKISTSNASYDIAMDADGDYVIVWEEGDYSAHTIYAQAYSKSGIPQGNQLTVSASDVFFSNPQVAMAADGSFVVVWQSAVESGGEFFDTFFLQKYNNARQAQGNPVSIYQVPAESTRDLNIAMDQDGDFVVTWEGLNQEAYSYYLYAQRYDKAGTLTGVRLSVDKTNFTSADADVAMDADGDFVVAWRADHDSGSGINESGIYARRYNKDGIPQGNYFEVDAGTFESETCGCTSGIKHHPTVAMDAVGNFVIAWDSDFENTNDISGRDIFFERFDANGNRLDVRQNNLARKANEWSGNNRYNEFAKIAMDTNGNFTIVWQANGNPLDGSCSGIMSRSYDQNGKEKTGEYLVNIYTKGNQFAPGIAINATGDFVVAWQSEGECDNIHTNAQKGIYSRLYQLPTNIALATTTVAENLPVGTIVGTLASTDATAGDAHAYSLVTGDGSLDNGSFTISSNELKSNSVFNFETRKVEGYSIRVRSTDAGGMYVEKTFKVMVTDVNEAPSNVTLNTNAVFENSPVATPVGSFSTTDVDAAGTAHTYTLVTGTGDTDNASFVVTGNQLVSNAVFDFETKSNFSIRVRSTDTGGLFFEKVFSIVIPNINDTPTLSDISPLQIQDSDSEQTITLANISSGGETNQILTVTAIADQPELITGLTVTYMSPNNSGSLRFRPVAGKSGIVNITIRVTDNGGTANGAINFIEKSFRVDILGLPKAPFNLSAKANDQLPQKQIDLVWRDVEQETGYRIQVSVGDDTNFQNIEPEGVTDINDTTFSHTLLQAGTKYFYRVVAYNQAGISPVSEVVGAITASDIITNIEDEAENNYLSIYPNPTSGNLRVDISALFVSANESCILHIYNAQSRSVWIGEWKGTNQQTMNISQWQAGMYLFVFTSRGKQVIKQIIKY